MNDGDQAGMRAYLKPGIKAGLLCLGAALLLWLNYRVSAHFPKTSDQANIFLAAQDMRMGNWQLRGWTMLTNSYWTSDVLIGALLSALWGRLGGNAATPAILILLPALAWTTLVLTAGYLAMAPHRRRTTKAWAMLIVMSVIGLPVMGPGLISFITLSAIHIWTIFYCLLAFITLERIMRHPAARRGYRRAVLFGALALGQAGDPLTTLIAAAPICTALALLPARSRKDALKIGFLTICAVLCGQAAVMLNHQWGGFTCRPLFGHFANYTDIATNFSVALHASMQVFSADFFGQMLPAAWVAILHLPLFIAGIAMVIMALANIVKRLHGLSPASADTDILTMILVLGCGFDVLAVLLSNRIKLEGNGIAAGRYLFPLWIFTAILLAQRAQPAPLRYCALAALLAASWADRGYFYAAPAEIAPAPQRALAEQLKAIHAVNGIGTYWQSSIMTVATLGAVHAYPAILDEHGKIVPFLNALKTYRLEDVTKGRFFVVVPASPETYAAQDVVANFGPPLERVTVAGAEAYLYAPRGHEGDTPLKPEDTHAPNNAPGPPPH
jgi:hypothetical protein